jgi:hypothetical protein
VILAKVLSHLKAFRSYDKSNDSTDYRSSYSKLNNDKFTGC